MTTVDVLVLGAGYGFAFVFVGLMLRQVRRKQQAKTMVQIEFHGGPKDGDEEAIPHGMTRWTVTRLVPVLAPHWSRAEDDPTDLYRVHVVGWYERQGTTMHWRAA